MPRAAPQVIILVLAFACLVPAAPAATPTPPQVSHPHGPEGGADSHSDGSYDIPVWFNWPITDLDVFIVPPAHGQLSNGNGLLGGGDPLEATPLNSYLRATVDGVVDWKRAVGLFGSPWLRDALVIDVYVIGVDVVPPDVRPEVLIVADETKGPILGWAWSTSPCLVDNSMAFLTTSFTYADMYNVNGQEFGHCLGLNHVSGGHPTHDVMNGGYPHGIGNAATKLHCISNLDVAGLERVFDGLGGSASLPVSQWRTTRWSPGCEL